MNRWSFGHPEAHLLPATRGDVLIVFYAGATPRLSMHWARVAP
jgi:hypothetical protein